MRELAHLSGLTLADKRARVGRFEALADDSGNTRTGAFGQCFEFVERFFAADSRVGAKFDSDQDGVLVSLMGDVVGFGQVLTSAAKNLRLESIRYAQSPVRESPQFALRL
jgi:hypothetical protein